MLDAIALVVAFTALLAWVNARFLRLPTTIGVMTMALLLSLAIVALGPLGLGELHRYEAAFLHSIDFTGVLLDGMLSLLLFAGALHIDLPALRRHRGPIAVLAVLGTIASTVIIGWCSWWCLGLLGTSLPLAYCLAFGALISPTDPIAVLGVLRGARVPESLEMTIAGESLFNDGVGVVLFTIALGAIAQGEAPTLSHAVTLFVREALGGAAYGLVIGGIAYAMLRAIDDAHVEILVTLGLVLGGYALARMLHVSGPIAMVVAGVLIGNEGRRTAMSEHTRSVLDTFWAVIDEILNAVLFVLIGLEVVILVLPEGWVRAASIVVLIVVASRALTAGLPVHLGRRWFDLPAGAGRMLTWSGVRGGISVALALALPPGPARDLVVLLTYATVLFSILVQGLTVAPLARRIFVGQ
jgi:CPA1 family monovalent cation:H+ antiporter